VAEIEASFLSAFGAAERRSLRSMLFELIGDDNENVKGSCV